MSLYVGGLSPHVRPDELERVFRRFGRCYFQLKDGYGFVVYEVTANAERALRALRGKNVCGEHISLSWSNKQPRPFQKPTRGPRFDQPYHRRMFREEDEDLGIRGSQDRRDFSAGIRLPAYNHGASQVDGADKESGHTQEDADNVRGNKGEILTDELIDEDNAELNPLEHDRWGEPIGDALPSHGAGNASDFDRYEPYHGYNRRDEKENNLRANSGSSPNRSLRGKGQKEYFIEETDRNFDKSKLPLTCYNCGQVGHIKRQCPEGDSRRERFPKFDQIRDEVSLRDREGRLKKFQANSWGRPSTSRDPFVARRRPWDRKELHSDKGTRSVRSRCSPERMEKQRSKVLSVSPSKKRTKKHYRSKKKIEKRRRAKISDTSSVSSDSSKSSSRRSQSKSNSGTRSHSTSRSTSSRSHRTSSRSRSISVSSYAKSKSSRSRSRSISRSRSTSLLHRSPSVSVSISFDQKSSSLKNMKTDVSLTTSPVENSEHMEVPESKHFFELNNSELKTLKDETMSSVLGVKNQYSKEYSGKTDGSAHKSALKIIHNERDACGVLNGTVTTSENLERSTFQETHSMRPGTQIAIGSTRTSTLEMLSALRHYGLVLPEEDEPDVSVEEYFGSARLWPWEMIYYRRLKRGPITTENYARRIQQNKEFGIVDKYIRSSSGWGEI